MFKFAFLMNMPGHSPETYKGVYENAESYSLIAGTDSTEMTGEYIKTLALEGFEMVDLCGDFDADQAEAYSKATGDKMKIRAASYFDEELTKLEALSSMKEYGIIIAMRGVEDDHFIEIKCSECNSAIYFVKADVEAAKKAAVKLVEKGMDFIELCSWFDGEKTKEIIKGIDGKIPVGTCGEL